MCSASEEIICEGSLTATSIWELVKRLRGRASYNVSDAWVGTDRLRGGSCLLPLPQRLPISLDSSGYLRSWKSFCERKECPLSQASRLIYHAIDVSLALSDLRIDLYVHSTATGAVWYLAHSISKGVHEVPCSELLQVTSVHLLPVLEPSISPLLHSFGVSPKNIPQPRVLKTKGLAI